MVAALELHNTLSGSGPTESTVGVGFPIVMCFMRVVEYDINHLMSINNVFYCMTREQCETVGSTCTKKYKTRLRSGSREGPTTGGPCKPNDSV